MKQIATVFILLISLTLIQCKSSSDALFNYKRGKQKVEIRLENDAKFLVEGEKTNLYLTTKNVNGRRLYAVAPGLKFKGITKSKDTTSLWHITAYKKYTKNQKLKLTLFFRGDNKNKRWGKKFLIPVKTNSNP